MDDLKCLADLEEKRCVDPSHAEEIVKEYNSVLQAKHDLKREVLSTESELLLLQHLSRDPDTWSSFLTTADGSLQESRDGRRKAKDDQEEVKDQIIEICDTTSEEIEIQKINITKLKQKLEDFQKKKADIEESKPSDIADSQVQPLQATIQQLEGVIADQTQKLKERSQALEALQKQQSSKPSVENQTFVELDSVKSILEFVEAQDGLKLEMLSEDMVKVNFLSGPTDLSLALTLTVTADHHGNIRLTNVQSNVENFNISQLVKDSIEMNSIPLLILTVRQLWQHHFPLLSEMDYLIKHHAVDWIPETGLLRVLVGNGKLMFTLKVPCDYPTTRDITLIDVFGMEMPPKEELPASMDSLRTWVTHLEGKFENV